MSSTRSIGSVSDHHPENQLFITFGFEVCLYLCENNYKCKSAGYYLTKNPSQST